MRFLEVGYMERTGSNNMPAMHSHSCYELHFLLKGTRKVFFKNTFFDLQAKSLCVIPPFLLHKMEGEDFQRVVVYIHESLLNEEEIEFFRQCIECKVVALDEERLPLYTSLLREAYSIPPKPQDSVNEYQRAFVKSLLFLLQQQGAPHSPAETQSLATKDATILEIIYYIYGYYQKNITLQSLCDKFFISKATLCRRFRKVLNCSPMEYLLEVRITKAKDFLINSSCCIEHISFLCGFSSACYFGLIFKKYVGVSPLNYRKQHQL